MEKWNYEQKWNYMYLAKVQMDPRKRKLQETFTCTRSTFLPLSSSGSTHLTQMHSMSRFPAGTKTVPTIPLTPFYRFPGLGCGCSLSTDIQPSRVWYQSHIPAGKTRCKPCLCCRGHCCGQVQGWTCWMQSCLMLTELETKSRAGLLLLHPPSQAFKCDSHLLKMLFCAAHRA